MGPSVGPMNKIVSGVIVVSNVGANSGDIGACVYKDVSIVGTAGSVTVAEACGVWVSIVLRIGGVELGVEFWQEVNRTIRATMPDRRRIALVHLENLRKCSPDARIVKRISPKSPRSSTWGWAGGREDVRSKGGAWRGSDGRCGRNIPAQGGCRCA